MSRVSSISLEGFWEKPSERRSFIRTFPCASRSAVGCETLMADRRERLQARCVVVRVCNCVCGSGLSRASLGGSSVRSYVRLGGAARRSMQVCELLEHVSICSQWITLSRAAGFFPFPSPFSHYSNWTAARLPKVALIPSEIPQESPGICFSLRYRTLIPLSFFHSSLCCFRSAPGLDN